MTERNVASAITRFNRRVLVGAVPTLIVANAAPQSGSNSDQRFGMPIGLPDRIPGDGCYIRHGYACENTGFTTGWWHTGENWYTIEGNSAGALVYAVAVGEVVYADADYPGRVVIIRHEDDLYSMYGHLDYELFIAPGDVVELGQTIGTVLFRTDTRSLSHLHFEMRTFLTTPQVNGASPRYDYPCGVQCPPGPGYWPMSDPDHPSSLGWLNPMHVIAQRFFPDGIPAGQHIVVASRPFAHTTAIWPSPEAGMEAERIDQMILIPGQRFVLVDIEAGNEATTATSADSYDVWYEIEALNGLQGWIRVLEPSSETTGVDGRPSALRTNFLVDNGSH